MPISVQYAPERVSNPVESKFSTAILPLLHGAIGKQNQSANKHLNSQKQHSSKTKKISLSNFMKLLEENHAPDGVMIELENPKSVTNNINGITQLLISGSCPTNLTFNLNGNDLTSHSLNQLMSALQSHLPPRGLKFLGLGKYQEEIDALCNRPYQESLSLFAYMY